jgi:hypothetical protein
MAPAMKPDEKKARGAQVSERDMAKTMIESMRSFQAVLSRNDMTGVSLRAAFAHDPLGVFTRFVDAIEDRHVRGIADIGASLEAREGGEA